ncbi:hypothetical protein Q9L58_010479, partial [Maublancomyces gigas]
MGSDQRELQSAQPNPYPTGRGESLTGSFSGLESYDDSSPWKVTETDQCLHNMNMNRALDGLIQHAEQLDKSPSRVQLAADHPIQLDKYQEPYDGLDGDCRR